MTQLNYNIQVTVFKLTAMETKEQVDAVVLPLSMSPSLQILT